VVDYTRDDFTRRGQHYDLIYDAVGNRSVTDLQRALAPGGRCVIAGFSNMGRLFEHLVLGPLRSKFGTRPVGMMPIAEPNRPDLEAIAALLEASQIVPVIDRSYGLGQAAEAIRYLERGHARGKVVVMVAPAAAAATSQRSMAAMAQA
jgi:NADPH:quinone reductase-like Zn-dependent oxidoreductase